ncbi:hypothetical protein SCP_0116920 [Sparassis crispa]|uniref:Uncharacterized protein n=1 Tax=Sparassis crispa TaxID=139825 RepID=A0A401G9H6_9APHY|nr:hypothetical protein SCP_0116920 [Sparassis crispa]GBE78799.1 hypothetical protein SCP_0116920 [Sparassis crispa]
MHLFAEVEERGPAASLSLRAPRCNSGALHPPSRSQRPLAGPPPLSAPFLDPLPISLDARRPIAANDAPVSSHRPLR